MRCSWTVRYIKSDVTVNYSRVACKWRSHGSVRVVRTTSKVNGKCWTLTPKPPMNPLSDRHQIWRAWLRHGYLPTRKNGVNPLRGFFSPHRRNIHPNVRYAMLTHVYYFFWFFHSPTGETPGWILTLNTSNDVVLRKEVPSEGYKNKISYLTEFWWKMEKN